MFFFFVPALLCRVSAWKTVKLNCLDAGFRSRVEALRAKELHSIRRALTLNAYNQVGLLL